MAYIRFTVHLPTKGDKQQEAARKTLMELRWSFPGGTWISGVAYSPVIWGWWDPPRQRHRRRLTESALGVDEARRLHPPDVDSHIAVSIDAEVSDPDSTINEHLDKIRDTFLSHYRGRGVVQKVVYVTCQDLVPLSFVGKSPTTKNQMVALDTDSPTSQEGPTK